MTIRKERAAREALQVLAELRAHTPQPDAFDEALAALQQVLDEYNSFDTSLVLLHRLAGLTLDEDSSLRERNVAVGLRLAKVLAALWDIHYASRQDNAERGPLHAHIAQLEMDVPVVPPPAPAE